VRGLGTGVTTAGVVAGAASVLLPEALGLDRTHLYRKMKALGISARE